MSVVIETTLGDITVDLYLQQRPVTCLNFLKLCKMKYYNFNLFHSIRSGFIAQTGDPTGEGSGGQSIFGLLEGPEKRFFSGEKMPKIRHTGAGLLSLVGTEDMMVGSQFFFTLAPDLDSLDGMHCVIGEVTEGHEVLRKLNDVICDEKHRPYRDVRITHTVVLEDPFSDPKGLRAPSRSPSPSAERLQGGRIAPDEEIDETEGKSAAEIQEMIDDKEAKARATILEIVGDLPDAEIAPPENVLFVCKLNPVTSDEDLEIIFSRFGEIVSCEVIRDKKTGDSLQYAFIEFSNKKSCEDAYFKMDNVLIDDRRIHVDFSQSVSKMKWLGKGRGVKHFTDEEIKNNRRQEESQWSNNKETNNRNYNKDKSNFKLKDNSNDRSKASYYDERRSDRDRNRRERSHNRSSPRESRDMSRSNKSNSKNYNDSKKSHKDTNQSLKDRDSSYYSKQRSPENSSRSHKPRVEEDTRKRSSRNEREKHQDSQHNNSSENKDLDHKNKNQRNDNKDLSKNTESQCKTRDSTKNTAERHQESKYSNRSKNEDGDEINDYRDSDRKSTNSRKNNRHSDSRHDASKVTSHESRDFNKNDKYSEKYDNKNKSHDSKEINDKDNLRRVNKDFNKVKDVKKSISDHEHIENETRERTNSSYRKQNSNDKIEKVNKSEKRSHEKKNSKISDKKDKSEKCSKKVTNKKKRKPSTSSDSESSSSSSSSESSSSSDSDEKNKKSRRKRKHSSTSSSSSSTSSSSSSSESSSESSSSSDNNTKKKNLKKSKHKLVKKPKKK